MTRLKQPTARTCERCGRHERWDDDLDSWRVEEVGEPLCIHEWDINGTFNPFEDA
ncbi:HEWD family protein [Haloarchaeobius sp. HRN-SO-5]|uniref:HEWD family protein n=1 Tax=Haloarchaeobius sp. HRN-SO-5 TaxID=3446118 RepID=UPI003EBA3D0B